MAGTNERIAVPGEDSFIRAQRRSAIRVFAMAAFAPEENPPNGLAA